MADEGSTIDVKAADKSLHELFLTYAKRVDSDNPTLTNEKCHKMLRDSKITSQGSKYITETDVDIAFSKVKPKYNREINFQEFQYLLSDLAKKDPSMSLDELINKLISSAPETKDTTEPVRSDRLTDTSKYTGSHKQRFDESGKGKGIHGREDAPDTSGYVGAYKKGSYDKV